MKLCRPSVQGVIVTVVLGVALLLVLFSLRWPVTNDLPIMLYDGFLIADLGLVPYRDFFEFNPPGTLLVYAALHRITAGGDLACRVVDLLVLLGISLCMCGILREQGRRAGLLASGCFAIAYILLGPDNALQREYLCTLALATSMWLALKADARTARTRTLPLTVGLLGGVVLTVKPPLALCWFPLFVHIAAVAAEDPPDHSRLCARSALRVGLPFALGAGIVMAVIAVYLWVRGGLAPFIQIVTNYHPLYVRIGGEGNVLENLGLGDTLRSYVLPTILIPKDFCFSLAAFIGAACAALVFQGKPSRRRLITLSAVTCLSLLYVPMCGKFWPYHKIPFFYCLSVYCGLLVSPGLAHALGGGAVFPTVLAAAFLSCLSYPISTLERGFFMLRTGTARQAKGGDVDAVATYLRDHLGSGDTVLVLDVADGGIHALYKNRIRLYGRFIYDLQFYHHTDTAYIRGLRDEFTNKLKAELPTFIVVSRAPFRPSGHRCSPTIPYLEQVIAERYGLVLSTPRLQVLQLKPSGIRSLSHR